MKKLMIAVLIVALISATIGTGCSPIENSNFMKGQKFLEQDEIIEIFEENKEGRCIRLTSSNGKEVNSDGFKAPMGSCCCADAVCIRVF